MSGNEAFQAGQLDAAVQAQTQAVKAKPADQDARFQLFVFLCFAGDLERAEKQLDVLGNQDERAQLGSLVYRNLLAAELERRNVYEHGERPVLPPTHPAFIDDRLKALGCVRRGDLASARAHLDRAAEAADDLAGSIDGEAFDGICDHDDVLGSVLEVFAGGRYLWIPFQHVRRLEIAERQSALDYLWTPAQLDDADGESVQVHLPVLYAGSHAHPDDAVRLGRQTDWAEDSDVVVGRGQHIWFSVSGDDTRDHEFLGVRRLEITGTVGAA